jgi:hypothetical protein
MVCSGSGQVVSLSLPFYGLTGTLSTAFGNLTFLRMLNLSSNSFRGEVLATIVRLAHLHALDLSYNAFSGTLFLGHYDFGGSKYMLDVHTFSDMYSIYHYHILFYIPILPVELVNQ